MSNMNFNCDVCGREVLGYTFVNGMRFCAKCYQETFGETEKDRKIADLESKLTEKDEENDKLTAKLEQANEIINNPDTLIFQQQELIDNLQIIIKEKEKEIESYKHFNVTIGTMENNQVDISSTTYTDQDKISFALEQLEKVKKLMRSIDMPNKPELYNNDMFGAGFDSHYIRVEKLIDNQINELKELK